MDKLKVLDLFSGIGGFSIGLERTGGFETVAFCEIEEFPRKVLNKHWPDVPIYNDVRTLEHDGAIDVICGGYPCQPFSVAGNRKGKDDDRHLWPAMFSLIKKHRPTWVIGENVAGHINMGLDDVLADLEGENYECRAFVIPACAVDAKHRRDRVWIIANSNCERRDNGFDNRKTRQLSYNENWNAQKSQQKREGWVCRVGAVSEDVADAECWVEQAQLPQQKQSILQEENKRWTSNRFGSSHVSGGEFWTTEPNVGRVADGVPRRVDRLKSLGNAVVPQIPEIIGNAILEAQNV